MNHNILNQYDREHRTLWNEKITSKDWLLMPMLSLKEKEQVEIFSNDCVKEKLKEVEHQNDFQKEYIRIYNGKCAEWSLRNYLGMIAPDLSIGNSYLYIGKDIEIDGKEFGIKCSKLGQAPLIFKNPTISEIILIQDRDSFYNSGATIEIILKSLDEIGYNVFYKILNASDYGIPQARERAYFICIRKNIKDIKFNFPEPFKKIVCLNDFLEIGITPKKITKYEPEYKIGINLAKLSDSKSNKPIQIGKVHYGGQGDRIYSPYGHAITLSANGGGNFSKSGGYYIDDYPRKLTPRECANIMGFPKTFILHEKDNTARKQFGNSVVVPVIKCIFEQVILTNIFENEDVA